jgi:hypothetical protein
MLSSLAALFQNKQFFLPSREWKIKNFAPIIKASFMPKLTKRKTKEIKLKTESRSRLCFDF